MMALVSSNLLYVLQRMAAGPNFYIFAIGEGMKKQKVTDFIVTQSNAKLGLAHDMSTNKSGQHFTTSTDFYFKKMY